MQKIPFSPPRIDEKVIQEVTDALRSGWITTGPRTKALEGKIEVLADIPKAFCVNSATNGMELMLRWFGVGEGDEVIVPCYTYCATANVVRHVGATPIMVDIRPDDLTMDMEKMAAAITTKTKAIMPVDLGGMPVNYTDMWAYIDQKSYLFHAENEQQKQLGRPLVLTDAAHSLGARYEGKASAKQADATVFSFHAVKNLTTAEGGAIALNLPEPFDNQAIYKALNTKALHGQNKDALAKFGANSWEYDVIEAGYKMNMPDVLAAIGLTEIDRYESETLPQRRAIFEQYTKLLSSYDWAELPVFETEEKCSSYHLYCLRIKGVTLAQRNEIISQIMATGVSVNVHYKPLPLLTAYKNLGYKMSNYLVAQDAWEREITLPVFYDLTEVQVERVVGALVGAYQHI